MIGVNVCVSVLGTMPLSLCNSLCRLATKLCYSVVLYCVGFDCVVFSPVITLCSRLGSKHRLTNCIVLCFAVLLYCIVLYYVVLDCFVFNCIVLYLACLI